MLHVIGCRDHGRGPAAAMCRHLGDDPSLEWVEVPTDPEFGDEFRDWRCRRCARRPGDGLFDAGDLSMICLPCALALQESAKVMRSAPATRLSVVAKPEKQGRKGRK